MNILEIGAANGPATFQIASKQPQSVVGSDIVHYQINKNVIRKENQQTNEQESNYLNKARKKVGEFFDKKTKDIVSFIEDDICKGSPRTQIFQAAYNEGQQQMSPPAPEDERRPVVPDEELLLPQTVATT